MLWLRFKLWLAKMRVRGCQERYLKRQCNMFEYQQAVRDMRKLEQELYRRRKSK
jgi:hypothetical protein